MADTDQAQSDSNQRQAGNKMVKEASSRDFASQPGYAYVRSEMTHSRDDCKERQHRKERKPKSLRQGMVHDKPGKCQPH